MEFRARYALIGIFTIAVIACVFAFVYWLNTVEGFQKRDYYTVRFDNPVVGLVRGSRVLFNGIQIGEVSDLKIDFDKPQKLFATIAIETGTPLRADTVVGLDYQSLTGGAAIVLSGKGTSTPLLKSSDNTLPMLVADDSVGLNWSQSAGRVLGKIDSILTENKEPLNDSLKNIKTFTDILSKNSERVENILAGLERFSGSTKDKSSAIIYDLEVSKTFTPPVEKASWQLVIAEPGVQLALNTDKILKQAKAGEITTFEAGRWSDNLPNFFQTKLIHSFENAGYGEAVSKPSLGAITEYQLAIDIRKFHLSIKGSPRAEVIFNAKLVDQDGKILKSRLFVAHSPATDTDVAAATSALSEAFRNSVRDLILWTVDGI